MFYSDDFKKKVKDVYPWWFELHDAMNRGDYLDEYLRTEPGFSYDEILDSHCFFV